jgi:hypothetical protein
MTFASSFKPPKRNDDDRARRWRGPLFDNMSSPLTWMEDLLDYPVGKYRKYYKALEQPKSVTFPICAICNHIVWEWPHFEEAVPDNAICGQCFKEEEEANERDNR